MAKKKLTTVKNKTWSLFSEYVRKRDANEYGYCKCITCDRVLLWNKGDAGHYVSRKYVATFLEETNVHFQCKGCNGFHGGRQDDYALEIIKRYGQEELERLNHLKYAEIKVTIPEYEEKIEELKEKIKIENERLGLI